MVPAVMRPRRDLIHHHLARSRHKHLHRHRPHIVEPHRHRVPQLQRLPLHRRAHPRWRDAHIQNVVRMLILNHPMHRRRPIHSARTHHRHLHHKRHPLLHHRMRPFKSLPHLRQHRRFRHLRLPLSIIPKRRRLDHTRPTQLRHRPLQSRQILHNPKRRARNAMLPQKQLLPLPMLRRVNRHPPRPQRLHRLHRLQTRIRNILKLRRHHIHLRQKPLQQRSIRVTPIELHIRKLPRRTTLRLIRQHRHPIPRTPRLQRQHPSQLTPTQNPDRARRQKNTHSLQLPRLLVHQSQPSSA